ncbi:MAG: DUF3857 domain-containing protein [Alphaproteobacteria bacterium]|nr:MAG: DUF3857 domain-containing protein [Alphaproteobacteria bacterium]
MAFGEGRAPVRAEVEFGPPPSGFDLTPYSVGDRDTRALSDRGLCFWLSDALIDVTGPEKVYTSRIVQQILGADGLQSAASFEVVFDPAHERLVVHAARVHREGQVRETASPQAFEILRRELNLERAIYDGRVTAHMIIPDVRVGDVVETSFSIIGANPALGGRLSQFATLQWGVPTVETRCRLRLPHDRPVRFRLWGSAEAPQEEVHDGVRQMSWSVLDRDPWRSESDVPAWWVGYDAVHVMDDCSWSDVADLFVDHYAAPTALPDDLAHRIDEIAARHATPAARSAEALRFVQQSLRYHSIGVGEGGFRPRDIPSIWETRYGDCKDASRLLTTVLRRLGVEACPALVHTTMGADLAHSPPFAGGFNHCIVRAMIDGVPHWLDATRATQAGDLGTMTPVFHHHALPLIPGATLEAMTPHDPPCLADVQEIWTFQRRADAGAEVEIVTVYRGARADSMRNWAANDGLATISRRLREDMEGIYGPMEEKASMVWRDRDDINELECVEHYHVTWPFVGDREAETTVRFETRDDVVGHLLRTHDNGRRQSPIDLGSVRRLRTRRIFRFAVNTNVTPWDVAHSGPGCYGHSVLTARNPREAELLLEVGIRQETVPADRTAEYFNFARRMRAVNGVTFAFPLKGGKIVPSENGETTWVGWAVAACVVIAIAAFRILSPA